MDIVRIRDINDNCWKGDRRRKVEKKTIYLVIIETSQPSVRTSMKIQGKSVVTKA